MPASRCHPPTARPGTSNHERGLAIAFALIVSAAVATAAKEFLVDGTAGFWDDAVRGMAVSTSALRP